MEIAIWLLGGFVLLVLLNRLVLLAFWPKPFQELAGKQVNLFEEVTFEASGIVPGGVSWTEKITAKPVGK